MVTHPIHAASKELHVYIMTVSLMIEFKSVLSVIIIIIPSSMFCLDTDKEQWSISTQFSGIVSLHFVSFECPSDGWFGDTSEIHS